MLSSYVALALGLAGFAGLVYQVASALLVRRFMAAPRLLPASRPP
ncbi:MAG TPA: glycosyl transferase, partial [Rhodospirillaceae bacterium]|nr:glycosyl transferase [Rhodospirillaceae bacterium]